MIKKIEIQNIGRFKSAGTVGDDEFFKKNTYIYGKNTYGKSTLTAIFRSLKDNNPDYIIGRKTFGSQSQTVKIVPANINPVSEYRYTTNEAKWNEENKNIAIFDGQFVRESVYTQTQQIEKDQQKRIEAFMLGSTGFDYNAKINEIDKNILENKTTQSSITSEYNRHKHLLGHLDMADFLALQEDPKVDEKISTAENNLSKIKNTELITAKLETIKSKLEKYKNFDPEPLSDKLSVNSDSISEHYETHINNSESADSYSSFLQSGSKLRLHSDNEKCPFCTQNIEDQSIKDFLNTIDVIYNDKYKNLQKAIQDSEKLFLIENFSKEIEHITTDLNQVDYVLGNDFSDLDILLKDCKELISKKKEDISIEINTDLFDTLTEAAVSHTKQIDVELENFETLILRKKDIDKEISNLKAKKERFSSWKERCQSYKTAKDQNATLSNQRKDIWDQYIAYANTLSDTMLLDINTILDSCSCDFTVEKFQFQGNQRSDLLTLRIKNNAILNTGADNESTIKNSLSDSDKWILALAFFLTTVKNDDDIKIVVMDDPVSSFDFDRRRIIIHEIKKIIDPTDKQLILLTHEKGFYHLLHAEKENNGNESFIQIVLDVTNGSDIVVCDPGNDSHFMSDYHCWVSDMKNALDSTDEVFVKNAHAGIRKVMEHIVKAKYSNNLSKEDNTLGKMITKLEEENGPYSTKSPRVKIEAISQNLTHHDNSGQGQYPVDNLGINDYKKDIKDTFDVMIDL